MRSEKFSLLTLLIIFSIFSLIVLAQYFSIEYMGVLSKKVAQAIAETKTPIISITATEKEER